jgi:hypothetical protein
LSTNGKYTTGLNVKMELWKYGTYWEFFSNNVAFFCLKLKITLRPREKSLILLRFMTITRSARQQSVWFLNSQSSLLTSLIKFLYIGNVRDLVLPFQNTWGQHQRIFRRRIHCRITWLSSTCPYW